MTTPTSSPAEGDFEVALLLLGCIPISAAFALWGILPLF